MSPPYFTFYGYKTRSQEATRCFQVPFAIAVALALLTMTKPAWAQSDGKLAGVVRDATTAGIPGATVAATSQFSKDQRTAATTYDLVNLRVGLRRNGWDVAFYVNNVFDERALLSFDRERGTLARIGFLTNQPRTFGISTRVDF